MTSKERIAKTLRGEIPDRIGRAESIWSETIVRWMGEGMKEGEDLDEKFGYDFKEISWADMTFQFPIEVVEDCDEYTVHWDGNGVLRKDIKRESGHTPHWMDHRIKTREDWERYRDRLQWNDDRLVEGTMERYKEGREKGKFVCYANAEAYECAWPVWGQVGIFTLMMDEPDLVAEVFRIYTDLIIASAERTLEAGADFDGAWLYGDLGYRNSTLFSPEIYRRLLKPEHKRMCDFFNERGKPVILHSCGRIRELIPDFIEAGFSAIQPLEVKAGQDVRELKALYGKSITFIGNIDVRKMSGTKEELKEELLAKLEVAKDGGYIYHSDHSVPPTVSWENYCYLMELLDEYGNY